MKKIILFDGDNTLWFAENNDYVSSVKSELKLVGDKLVERVEDHKLFVLRNHVREVVELLAENNIVIGVVSDNLINPVKRLLELYGVWQSVDKAAVNVRLWKGYCPKHLMVQEIMSKKEFIKVRPDEIVWIDDKDYAKKASLIGVCFHLIKKDENLN